MAAQEGPRFSRQKGRQVSQHPAAWRHSRRSMRNAQAASALVCAMGQLALVCVAGCNGLLLVSGPLVSCGLCWLSGLGVAVN